MHALFVLDAEALAVAMTRDASAPFERQAALSGLHGRELGFLEKLLATSAWKAEAPGRAELLRSLAELVVFSRDAAACAGLVAALEDPIAWRRDAMLDGVADNGRGGRAPKPIGLAARPTGLAEGSAKAKRALDFFTWPGDARPRPAPPRALTEAEQALYARGEGFYRLVCAKCHQDDGRGVAGLGPPLAGSPWATGPEGRLIRIALQGLTGPVEVDGEEWNLEMPAWEGALPDEALAATLTYVRRSWGNEADPVAPSTVAAVRAETRERAKAWTVEELRGIR